MQENHANLSFFCSSKEWLYAYKLFRYYLPHMLKEKTVLERLADNLPSKKTMNRRKFIANLSGGLLVLSEAAFYLNTVREASKTTQDRFSRVKVRSVEDWNNRLQCEGMEKVRRVKAEYNGREAELYFVGVKHVNRFAERHAEVMSKLLEDTGSSAFCTEMTVGARLAPEQEMEVASKRLTGIFRRDDLADSEKLKLLKESLGVPASGINYFEYVAQHVLITRRPTVAIIEGWNETLVRNAIAEMGADGAIFTSVGYALGTAWKRLSKLAARIAGKEPEKALWKDVTFLLSFMLGQTAGALLNAFKNISEIPGTTLIPNSLKEAFPETERSSPITNQRERYADSGIRAVLEEGHSKLVAFGGAGHTDEMIEKLAKNDIPAAGCFYDRVLMIRPDGKVESFPLE